MRIQHISFVKKENVPLRFLNRGLLVLLIIIPLSCSAQKSSLTRISSVERSDNKGHVIRFHLNEASPAFDFSQPQPYLVQFQLTGNDLDTSKIRIDDQSDIIKKVDYYTFSGGIGVDILLKEGTFYEAAAYPDRDSQDLLLALTKTTGEKLAKHIINMESFAWSNAKPSNWAFGNNQEIENESTVDTSYQKIKDKIKFDVVVLDAGHGGHDVGAIGYKKTYEKNVVLAITKKLVVILTNICRG
jgi:N-acetylmuramoyl-L-alanine amidase